MSLTTALYFREPEIETIDLSAVTQYDDWGIFEHCGPNRSGKTMLSATEAWLAYLAGLDVWCNCPTNPFTGEVEHILNFPHFDYWPTELFDLGLKRCYVMVDQAEQFMDAQGATKEVRNLGNWAYQAKKRTLAFHYDTVRHKNIYNRIRLNPDWIIYTKRHPSNWKEPIQAVELEITQDENSRTRYIVDPIGKNITKLYNDVVMVRPE